METNITIIYLFWLYYILVCFTQVIADLVYLCH